MTSEELKQRIIETADDYHFRGEEAWKQAVDAKPEESVSELEFRQILRMALELYARAYLVLSMVETDDGQDLEDLLEIVGEEQPEFEEFFARNNVLHGLDEESGADFSRAFAVAESVRALLLQGSNQLAATLDSRFSNSDFS